MFNKTRGAEIVEKDAKFNSSSDFKRFRSVVARLESESRAKEKTASMTENLGDDDGFEEARDEVF